MEGHNFFSLSRDNNLWKVVMDKVAKASEAGTLTFVTQLLLAEAKKALSL
jgi:hypothetical protein